MAVDRPDGWPSEPKGQGDKELQFRRSGPPPGTSSKVLSSLITEKQRQRIQQALATLQ
jgi:hypothetical protein